MFEMNNQRFLPKTSGRGANRFVALRLSVLPMLLVLAAMSLCQGCDPHSSVSYVDLPAVDPFAPSTSGKISVTDLAARLNLQVVSCNPDGATLRNSANCVSIFPDPMGKAYVNRHPLAAPVGGVIPVGNTLYVPVEMEGALRRNLTYVSANRPIPGGSIQGTAGREPRQVATRTPTQARGTVVIDPGHGGKDPGTRGAYGPEKNVVLPIAMEVARRLRQAGVTPVLTRDDDTFIELDDRVRIGNFSGARLFVSIHADASSNSANYGHTLIMPQGGSSDCVAIANDISRQLVMADSPRHVIRKDDRGLRVLRGANNPAVLVEVGFLSNSSEAARFASSSHRDAVGDAIADGIIEYLRGK
jgi:N-acetylmuramoyl-L-alanine amidase